MVALLLCFEVYGPALNGEFLFDDEYLPFLAPEVQQAPLTSWLGNRPVLMFSYWLNYQQSGVEPEPYHVVSIVLHAFNAVFAWLIVRRLLSRVSESGLAREVIAAFCGLLFLLHPIQTESVAYVASRSETLSVFFFLAAFLVYVYSPAVRLSLIRIIAVLTLFVFACAAKEHAVVLPVLLLLTDYFFTTPFRFEGIRQRFGLYLPIVLGGVAGGLFLMKRVLSTATSAGFQIQEFTWYQYLMTQFRVIPSYLRLYVLPVNLNGDYVMPISRTPLEHGAIIWFVVLAAISVLAWKYRRQYPLASFGWFGFLVLLAPTSSIIPIRDVIAERRIYLPFICLLLITAEFVRRIRMQPVMLASALGVLLVLSSYATYQRSQVWSTPLAFWTDTVSKSPENPRAHFQLAYAQWKAGQCTLAEGNYQKVAKLQKPDERLLIDWALALECMNKPDEAVARLREAAALSPSAIVYAQIGMIYGKRGRFDEAMDALNQAEKYDPRFDMTYVYKGNLFASRGQYDTAVGFYKHALAINPANETAQSALGIAERNLGKAR